MKKLLMMTIVASLVTLQNLHSNEKEKGMPGITLTSTILPFVDGKSFGVDAETVGLMLQIRRDIRKLQFGEKTKSGKTEGQYEFDGKHHSLRSLTLLENELEQEFYQKQETKRSNADWYSVEKAYNKTCTGMKATLSIAVNDFVNRFRAFANRTRRVKNFMVELISESCQLRNRPDSLLLKWVEADDEATEEKILKESLTTFKQFDQFLTDLVNFMEDLLRSCPRGWAQFKELIVQKQAIIASKQESPQSL